MDDKDRKIIKYIIADHVVVDPEDVGLNTYLIADLDIDDIDILELRNKIEAALDCYVDLRLREDGSFDDLTVGQLCDCVQSLQYGDRKEYFLDRFSSERCKSIGAWFIGAVVAYIFCGGLGWCILGFLIFSGLIKDIFNFVIYLLSLLLQALVYLFIAAVIIIICFLIFG